MAAQQEQAGLRETATIAFPGTEAPGTAWDLYNQMIAGIPEGVFLRDYCLGLNWSYVEADCGMGVAFTVRGGGSARIRRIYAAWSCVRWPSFRSPGAFRRSRWAS